MTTFTIGCDPEVFVRDSKKRAIIPAVGLVEGTKEEPHKIRGGAYQVDGLAVEFNTDPTLLIGGSDHPERWVDQSQLNLRFSHAVMKVMGTTSVRVKKNSLSYNLARDISTADFSQETMDSLPDEAKELGCEPDFNAYTMEENPRPDAENALFRTAGGHIHVGWGADIPVDHPDHVKMCAELIKTMDLYLGLASVFLDKDTRRRELYGNAGAFRPKSYGVEYRTLSNFWIFNEDFRRWVPMATRRAVKELMHCDGSADLVLERFNRSTLVENFDWAAVQGIINGERKLEAVPRSLCLPANVRRRIDRSLEIK